MLLNRTAAAFTLSAEQLAQHSPKIYFWTFTFKKVPINDDYAMEDWHALNARLQYHFPFCQGLRVCELHRSHGIHFHALLNFRIPIDRLRKIMLGSGFATGLNRYLDFGRMTVTKCDVATIGYMAKYLTKQYRQDNDFSGRRRWGAIGGFPVVKCRDIVYDTPTHHNKPLIFGKSKVDYATMMLLSHYSALWGYVDNWPAEYKMKIINFSTRHNGRDEEMGRQADSRRIDPDAILYSGHLEMCGQCKWGDMMCSKGRSLWLKSMFCTWRFTEDKVTECNYENTEGAIPEVEERDSGKNFLQDSILIPENRFNPDIRECGKRVYVLDPQKMYQKRTWHVTC